MISRLGLYIKEIMFKYLLLLLPALLLLSLSAKAELDVYDTSSSELRPFVIVTEKALESWSGYYEVVSCTDCSKSFFEDGQLMPQVKGMGISFINGLKKDHYKTEFDICFSEQRREQLGFIDCFGQGLSSYVQRGTGKRKVVSLGVRKDKFFYSIHDDFRNEYDKVTAVKDLESGLVTLTRDLKKMDSKTKKYKIVKYKAKLKLKKDYTIKVKLKI